MGSPAQPGTSPFQVLAWLLFTGFDVLILIYVIALPIAQPQNWDFLTIDRDVVAYIGTTIILLGMISVGFGILTIAISTMGFRSGDRAWYAFWFFPLFFLFAVPSTWPGIAWIPIMVLSIVALLISFRKIFTNQEIG
jgi:hypothetical protein